MMKCFMRIEKVKGKNLNSTLQSMSDHNYRVANVPNADANKSEKNTVLIDTSGKRDMIEAYYARMRESQYYVHGKQPRKDAVKLLDVMLGVTECRPENMENLEEWQQANVKWLQDTFGKDNVISAVVHMDEIGPHIHALVVPMTDDGRLCAKEILGDRTKMRERQADYASVMAPLGLVRGVIGSTAKHRDIRQFYAQINEAARRQIPMPEPCESTQDYYVRMQAFYTDISLAHEGEVSALRQAVEDMANIDHSHLFVLGEWEGLKAEQERFIQEKEKTSEELGKKKEAAERMLEIMYAIRHNLLPKEEADAFLRKMKDVARMGREHMQEMGERIDESGNIVGIDK